MLPALVNIAAVTDGVDDDGLLVPQDLEDDPVRSFSDLVETAQLSLERIELRGIEVGGEPLNSICNPLSRGLVEFLKLFRGRF